jgi:hypothetical protein
VLQRAVFPPVAAAIFLMSAIWLGAKGAVAAEIIKLFVVGLPVLIAGAWLGLKLYGGLDEATFRRARPAVRVGSRTDFVEMRT